jgi:hypothetical protein
MKIYQYEVIWFRKMSDLPNLHTNETRYFGGGKNNKVRELPPEEWASCKQVYPNPKKLYNRGYEVLEDFSVQHGTRHFKKGDKVLLIPSFCHSKPRAKR